VKLDRWSLNALLVNRIRGLRREHPDGRKRAKVLTQTELAQRAGLPRTTVTNIEGEKQLVSVELLYKLCHGLGVDLLDILPSVRELQELSLEELVHSDKGTRVRVDGKEHVLPAEWASAVKEATGE
jgi:transcriptional regulator with XRE-family HTH domain